VKLRRKHAVLFLAIAAWNVVTYATFTKNLAAAHAHGEDRPTGYWVAHTVLIIVNLVIAAVLARLGYRAWRSTDVSSLRADRPPVRLDS
jgi:ABC-type Na+ efflux pump permease subunit